MSLLSKTYFAPLGRGQNPGRAVQLSVPLRVDRHTQQALAPWNPRRIPVLKNEQDSQPFLLWMKMKDPLSFWDFNPLQQPFAAGIGWPEPKSN